MLLRIEKQENTWKKRLIYGIFGKKVKKHDSLLIHSNKTDKMMKISNLTRRGYYILLLLSTLILTGTSSCSSVPLTGRNRVMLVSDEAIIQSSALQYRQFMARAPRSHNQAATAQVRRVGERLARATEAYLRKVGLSSDAKMYRWEFNLVADRQINAFCMPGGKIVVYEGLLKYAKTDDELATVLSHEVAHAVAKHGNERISQALLRQYGANVLGAALGGQSVAIQQVAGAVYGIGSKMLVMLPYSRSHELEADKIGLYLMAMAGYNPEAAIGFWKKMSAGKSQQVPEILSTHPSDLNRIQKIEAELPQVNTFMGKGPSPQTPPGPKTQKNANNMVPDNAHRKVPLKTHY